VDDPDREVFPLLTEKLLHLLLLHLAGTVVRVDHVVAHLVIGRRCRGEFDLPEL
jgi:hypothetical protein